MVQILKSSVFALALLAETAAFVPFAAKLSPRIDSSKWRLEQYDVPASYGRRIRSSNGTDSTFVVGTSLYNHVAAPARPEVPSAVMSDTVDMSHYKSSFQGLTAPSKAGLVLSLLISLAMVASSPGVDTSFITSELASLTQLIDESSLREFSTVWSADTSQDLLATTLFNKLDLLASELSPKVDDMLQLAREQSETMNSNAALAYQSIQDFMNTVSAKSTILQGAFSAESTQLQEQAVSTMDQWQAMVASKMIEAQTVAAEVTAKGSRMMENAFLQATTFRDAVAGSMATLQNTVETTVQEIRTSMVTQFDETSVQLHKSMEDFRYSADERMLREGPILKAEFQSQAQQIVDPLALASDELWKSFNVELDREYSVASQTTSQSISWLQTFWETKFAELQDIPWLDASRDVEPWSAEMKTVLSEAVVKLQADLVSKATEIRDVEIPGAQKAIQVSLENVFQLMEARITELQATVSSATLAAQEQAYSNLAKWKEITDAEIAADQAALTMFYHDVTLKCESTMAQVSDFRSQMTSELDQIKEDYESFKKNADVKMLAEAPVLKEKAMNAQEQAKALFDTGFGKMAGPMAVFSQGWNALWNVDIPRVQDVVTTECSKLYLSFTSQVRPLQESLPANYGVAVNEVISSVKDTIRESVDVVRTESQSFASTAAATAKDLTETAISKAQSSGLSVTDQLSDVVSSATSKVDVTIDLLPDTKPVVESVKIVDASLPTLSQKDVSSESLSSLYDRLEDKLLKSP